MTLGQGTVQHIGAHKDKGAPLQGIASAGDKIDALTLQQIVNLPEGMGMQHLHFKGAGPAKPFHAHAGNPLVKQYRVHVFSSWYAV